MLTHSNGSSAQLQSDIQTLGEMLGCRMVVVDLAGKADA